VVKFLVAKGAQILPYILQTVATDCPSVEVAEFIHENGPPPTNNGLLKAENTGSTDYRNLSLRTPSSPLHTPRLS
jgi:hypothetical protein